MHARTPNIDIPASDLNQVIRKLPAFAGFPYLLTQVVGNFYHIILLPAELSAEALGELAAHQAWTNRLLTCFVRNPKTCTYFDPESGHRAATSIPRASCAVSDTLLPRVDFLESQEFLQRKRLLANFVEERNRTFRERNGGSGYLFGDLTKGGRAATTDELRRLSGYQRNGVPQGLAARA